MNWLDLIFALEVFVVGIIFGLIIGRMRKGGRK